MFDVQHPDHNPGPRGNSEWHTHHPATGGVPGEHPLVYASPAAAALSTPAAALSLQLAAATAVSEPGWSNQADPTATLVAPSRGEWSPPWVALLASRPATPVVRQRKVPDGTGPDTNPKHRHGQAFLDGFDAEVGAASTSRDL